MEKFANKYVDFKTSYAVYEALSMFEGTDEEEFKEAVKETLKDIDEEDVEEYKEELIDDFKEMVDENLKLKYVSITKIKGYDYFPAKQYQVAKFKDEDGENVFYTFHLYNKKIININKGGVGELYSRSDDEYDMDEDETKNFNDKLLQYVSDETEGEDVIRLLDTIMSMNFTSIDSSQRFIGVEAEDITGFDEDDIDDLDYACGEAYEDKTEENVEAANEEIANLKTNISPDKTYKVMAIYDSDIIEKIIVSEAE